MVLNANRRVGTTLANRYRLLSIIGSGGTGVVFDALDLKSDRKVAIKLLQQAMGTAEKTVRRFFREAQAARSLQHPNVVEMLDLGYTDDGLPFLVMELLEGMGLDEHLLARPLTVDETLAIAGPIIAAVATAHRKNVIHRDIKPGNVFLATDSTGRVTPKLLDFGIAKLLVEHGTESGVMKGTPEYMAPEQLQLDTKLTTACDVWAIGTLIYECLTQVVPHAASSIPATLLAILMRPPKPLAELAPEVPAALSSAVMRALAKDPLDRYPTMEAFAQALGLEDAG